MSKGHSHHHDSSKNIKVAFFLNLAFTIFEIIGGLYTNSMAILADATHDLGDSFSLGLSWALDKKSKQKGDQKYSYGYQRFSLLGALINGVVLVVGSFYILIETIPRLVTTEHSNAKGMLMFAVIGILVNGVAVFRLKEGSSLNERVVRLHLLEDVLGWIAVLIVSIILLFWDIQILDPILSILILSYVLFNVVKNLRKTIKLFLQAVPSEISIDAIKRDILSIENVIALHNINIWSLDGAKHVLSVHIVISDRSSAQEIMESKIKIKEYLISVPIEHITIEVEFEGENCYMKLE